MHDYEKMIVHLEKVSESTIKEMMQKVDSLDRNRLSGFLHALEELEIIESIGRVAHKRYRLRPNYLEKLEGLKVPIKRPKTKTGGSSSRWRFPHKTRLKRRKIKWSTEIPGGP